LPKEGAIALMPRSEAIGRDIEAFYESVLAYYPRQDSATMGMTVIERGVAFLESAIESYYGHASDGGEA
jgi:hypothetical protein